MNIKMQAFEDQFSSLTRQMGKWMDHVLGTSYRQFCPRESWSPSVNLYEDEDRYHVVVDLAGVEIKSIDVRVDSSMLIVRGHRETPRPMHVSGVLQTHLMEIDHGAFCRQLPIPLSVDTESISAAHKEGMLWIELPKKK